MAYIKFSIRKQSFGENDKRSSATISNFESDIANTSTLELNIIMHSLSKDLKPKNKIPLTFPFVLGGK